MGDESKKTVLVVDDEPDVRLFLQTILENGGYDVMLASHGKQALERMTEKKPDVISLDLVMPKMSGLKFYRYIQKNKDRRESVARACRNCEKKRRVGRICISSKNRSNRPYI
jgi:CheY-like chemotaxis protein